MAKFENVRENVREKMKMKATSKLILYKSKGTNKDGQFPIKIRIIWGREDKNFRTGVNLSENDFQELATKKSLKEDFKYLNFCIEKADKIINELDNNFSWDVFRDTFYDEEGTTKKNALMSLSPIS